MKRNTKGFTLIELLVVIAIIGILASIVLVSLGGARSKGNDAKIISQLASMRSAAEIYAGTNEDSYEGMDSVDATDSSGLYNLEQGDNYPGGDAPTIVLKSDNSAWAAYHVLSSDASKSACSDSTGASTQVDSTGISTRISASAAYCH